MGKAQIFLTFAIFLILTSFANAQIKATAYSELQGCSLTVPILIENQGLSSRVFVESDSANVNIFPSSFILLDSETIVLNETVNLLCNQSISFDTKITFTTDSGKQEITQHISNGPAAQPNIFSIAIVFSAIITVFLLLLILLLLFNLPKKEEEEKRVPIIVPEEKRPMHYPWEKKIAAIANKLKRKPTLDTNIEEKQSSPKWGWFFFFVIVAVIMGALIFFIKPGNYITTYLPTLNATNSSGEPITTAKPNIYVALAILILVGIILYAAFRFLTKEDK